MADDLGVTRATASIIVDRLVRRGLVDRVQDPRERRRVALTLTAPGGEVLEKVRECTRSRIAQALSSLAPERLRKVNEGIAILGNVLKEAANPDDKPVGS